ncbi:Stk1 family PASTA domain-containing Ser/Thr kinase [Rossellomorea vietnamensis]|uniref:Serine/threonine-protein kinase PrkC n=1 Tax=Rossellomorea vietnamensis TaxID=218284 RepID=A0A5D4MGC5_9BACI|nr:Stk1 family PASTA domain-containing Ser/Thr kinase [Rossellomorea vietnamensis]TYS00091.1 Stk1 family PASTA domain-containing Ser/Thr kinase [Rossellomorea vietnamensis]
MFNGKRISGRYKILEVIGGGGMANVYLAKDMILDREVAIKMLRLDFANEEEFIKRFQREAQSATSLAHPNIVSIYDVGEEDDIYYIVMEYVSGMTLKQYIQKHSPISIEKAIDIMRQLTSAIAHAHQNHIVHRDIKPQNILIDHDGTVKITDFGIAMALSSTSITQTNSVLGSVHYLSPEQARGGMATRKSDIYSLGIVMFELLSGRLPFSGESAVSIALKHLQSETPSLRRWNQDIPQSVENIVLKSTAKDPFQRYDSVEEIEEELRTALEPGRLDEPKFAIEEDMDATKAIPVITDERPYSNIEHTIVHDKNESETTGAASSAAKNDGKPPKKKKRKWPAIIIGVFFLLALLAILAVTVLPDMLGPKEVELPDVGGKTQEEAVEILVREGFLIGDSLEQANEEVPANNVIKTDPRAGRMVNEGSEINLYVSTGKKKVNIEDYTDQFYSDAEEELKELGFTDVQKEEESNNAEPGTIIDQNPSPDSEVIPDETTVTFTVSTGPATFELKDLTGLNQQSLNLYEDISGLKINRTEEFSEDVPKGEVISQVPEEGTPVVEGNEVSVVISKGRETQPPKTVTREITIPYEPEPENEGEPIAVEIYIEDQELSIDEAAHTFGIYEDWKDSIELTIEDGKTGKYKVLVNGSVFIEETTVPYPENEEE